MCLTGGDTDVEVALLECANHLHGGGGEVPDRAHEAGGGQEQVQARVLTAKLCAPHETDLQHHGHLQQGARTTATGVKDNCNGARTTATGQGQLQQGARTRQQGGGKDTSTGGNDTSTWGGKDTSTWDKDTSTGGKDTSTGARTHTRAKYFKLTRFKVIHSYRNISTVICNFNDFVN